MGGKDWGEIFFVCWDLLLEKEWGWNKYKSNFLILV